MLIYSVISITTLNTSDLKPQTEDKKNQYQTQNCMMFIKTHWKYKDKRKILEKNTEMMHSAE